MYILKHTSAYFQNSQTVNLSITNIFVPEALVMLVISIPLSIQELLNMLDVFPYHCA